MGAFVQEVEKVCCDYFPIKFQLIVVGLRDEVWPNQGCNHIFEYIFLIGYIAILKI